MYAVEFPERVSKLVLNAPANLIVMPPKIGDKADLFKIIKSSIPSEKKSAFDKWFGRLLDFSWQLKASEQKLAQFMDEIVPFYVETMKGDQFKSARDALEGEDKDWKNDKFLNSEMPIQGGYHNLAMYLGLGAHHNWSAAVAQLKLPTLVVHGSLDLIPEENSREFASYITGCEFAVVKGGGHYNSRECPEEVRDVVLPFINK
mmetsp:Transcript_19318/g.30191  ORF Transcript_19318/g.30191 Transcript_19318/m.30191 type:complete len:203 (-) Transcript_19318:70-678(-)